MNPQFKLILGSGSPRRKELLDMLGYDFDVINPSINESINENEKVDDYIIRISVEKALSIVSDFPDEIGNNNRTIIIAADTVVFLPDSELILGKPDDINEARRMLLLLSGRSHLVKTGFVLADLSNENLSITKNVVSTEVLFRKIDTNEIEKYIKSDEPFDKAGSYAIQGIGLKFVLSINGSYSNVVGLPLAHVKIALDALC
ncbi:MAG TPA: Maf family protein [Oligoflexia bacterium]|nr:Maf family protein [Oligoflexia bacterium]HMP48670.1 Maf family protein [Oligoflexia bacterium]